jgi:hypothetical protein
MVGSPRQKNLTSKENNIQYPMPCGKHVAFSPVGLGPLGEGNHALSLSCLLRIPHFARTKFHFTKYI